MYTVKFTTAYKKSYKLMKKRGLDLTLLDNVVEELRQGNPSSMVRRSTSSSVFRNSPYSVEKSFRFSSERW